MTQLIKCLLALGVMAGLGTSLVAQIPQRPGTMQPGGPQRPGGPPAGFGGNRGGPGGFVGNPGGGIPKMPTPIKPGMGIMGGETGSPTSPGISGLGSEFGGIGGRNITPEIPRGPIFENVWTCGKCSRELGNGAFPPAKCPHCGVSIINGIGGRSEKPIIPNQPGAGDFNANGNANFNPQPFNLNGPAFTNTAPDANTQTTQKVSDAFDGFAWMVFGIIGVVMFLLIVGGIIFVVVLGGKSKKKARRPARRPRKIKRRVEYDDDDDDDDFDDEDEDDRPRRRRRR